MPDSKPVFKSKLRIVLTNETGNDIDALAPDWIAETGDVPLQLPKQNFCCLQLEDSGGWKADKWKEEAGRLHIKHGETVRLRVGLDQSFSDADLRRRAAKTHLGLLVIPVNMKGAYGPFGNDANLTISAPSPAQRLLCRFAEERERINIRRHGPHSHKLFELSDLLLFEFDPAIHVFNRAAACSATTSWAMQIM